MHTAVWADELEGQSMMMTCRGDFYCLLNFIYLFTYLFFNFFYDNVFLFFMLFHVYYYYFFLKLLESSLYDLFCTDGVRDASRSDSIKIAPLSQSKRIALLSTFDMADAGKIESENDIYIYIDIYCMG